MNEAAKALAWPGNDDKARTWETASCCGSRPVAETPQDGTLQPATGSGYGAAPPAEMPRKSSPAC